MNYINFENTKQHIHFIGIGGISMSGLAQILFQKGFHISGSDMKSSPTTTHLQKLGIPIHIGHRASNISSTTDLIVYTAAIKEDNEERMAAIKNNIPTIDRAQLLGEIMKNYDYPIAVAGTHGKTTTTSMLTHIFLHAKKDPTITVGGMLDAINGNLHIGRSSYFITEACEYCDSFLKFYPFIALILNIEADHLDYFKDIKQIRQSFKNFAKKVPTEGSLVINSDIENIEEMIEGLSCNVITFGFCPEKSLWYPANITYDNKALGTFDIFYKEQQMGRIHLQVPGEHNIYNALSACATGYELGLPMETIIEGLSQYRGTHKRFEYKGNLKGITIIDDYAHHPTEIKATLKVAKQYPHKTLWCVFQPHTYTRTKAFLTEFSSALEKADKVILTDIYAAREKNTGEIHALDLLNELQKNGKEVYYFPTFEEIECFLLENCIPGDLLITMGAGDVSIIGEELLGRELSTLSTELSTISKT